MKKLDDRTFIRLLKKEKAKTVESYYKFHYPFLQPSYSLYTFVFKDYYFETECVRCKWKIEKEIVNLNIEILEVN